MAKCMVRRAYLEHSAHCPLRKTDERPCPTPERRILTEQECPPAVALAAIYRSILFLTSPIDVHTDVRADSFRPTPVGSCLPSLGKGILPVVPGRTAVQLATSRGPV